MRVYIYKYSIWIAGRPAANTQTRTIWKSGSGMTSRGSLDFLLLVGASPLGGIGTSDTTCPDQNQRQGTPSPFAREKHTQNSGESNRRRRWVGWGAVRWMDCLSAKSSHVVSGATRRLNRSACKESKTMDGGMAARVPLGTGHVCLRGVRAQVLRYTGELCSR